MKLLKELNESVEILTEATSNIEGDKKQYYIVGKFIQSEIENRNKRIYPKDAIKEEVDRYITEYVKTNRAYGELCHPECFHTLTEILTVDGWKLLKDVSVGELIYTLSDKGIVEIQPIKQTYKEYYNGKMISLKSRSIKTKVTPNHRFITVYRDNTYHIKTAQEIADNNFNHYYIPKATPYFSNDYTNDVINIYGEDVNFINFCSFLGIYLSEGCTTKHKKWNSYKTTIVQNEGDDANQIRKILNDINIIYSEYKHVNKYSNNTKITFYLHNKNLSKYLYTFGKAGEKFLDPFIKSKMSAESAQAFLNMYIIGDGRGQLKKKYVNADVFSISERMIDDITHVAFIAGIATRKYSITPNKDVLIENRVIKKENKHTLWFCQFIQTNGTYLDKRFIETVEEDYSDMVYCVNVDNGTFYARDGEYTFWTGNSRPTIDFDRVSHKIISLEEEGNDWVGKAIIADTDKGKIVKALIDIDGRFGVSSRGLGSLKPGNNGVSIVQPDFKLMTAADIVADPSAPDALVESIMEETEWVRNLNGEWIPIIDSYQKTIKTATTKQLMEEKIKIFQDFFSRLK